MIEVRNLNKSFETKQVLFDISATFMHGHVNQIIGQSGSGKTVLMKSVIGLFRAESGEVLYDGRNLSAMSEKEVKNLRREVGMLFQGSALFDSMSVLGNVMFPLEMFADMTKAEMERRAIFCLERVDLKPTAFSLSPSEISGGMQKRVAIARAIALNPKYLFCDEPNSGLDPKTSIVIDELLHDITSEYKITTIINTHDMNSVLGIGENIIFINKGHLNWTGSMNEIYNSDNEVLNNFVFATELFQDVRKYRMAHSM